MVVSFGLPVRIRTVYSTAQRWLWMDGWLGLWPSGSSPATEFIMNRAGSNRGHKACVTSLLCQRRDASIGDLHFDIGGIRVGFEICEDAWVANRPARRWRCTVSI